MSQITKFIMRNVSSLNPMIENGVKCLTSVTLYLYGKLKKLNFKCNERVLTRNEASSHNLRAP